MSTTPGRVLIAGAGPVGLVLALGLLRRGIPVTVFEKLPRLHDQPRAATIHPATLDLLDEIGLYQAIEPLGLIAPIVHYWDRHEDVLVASFDHAVLGDETRHPHVLQCEQNKLAHTACHMVHGFGHGEVRLATPVVGFTQDADGVELVVVNEAGTEERHRGAYLVGCDGLASVVRENLGIAFEGFTYPDRALIVGTPFDFEKHHGYALRNYLSDPNEWANLFKISWHGPPGLWRLVLPTRPDEEPDAILREESVQRRLQRFFRHHEPYEIVIKELYTVHQRVATDFRAGRVVLCGDAGHVNSPIGAMGMNGGIHDAVNLAAKLGCILQGDGEAALLDRYTRQRRHIAVAHTQAQTMANKKRLEETDPEVRKRNHAELARAAADPELARRFLRATALIESLETAAAIV